MRLNKASEKNLCAHFCLVHRHRFSHKSVQSLMHLASGDGAKSSSPGGRVLAVLLVYVLLIQHLYEK